MNSKTVSSLILNCNQFVAIAMYKRNKTFLTNKELYDEFVKINELLRKKFNGFVLYSNVYIKQMIEDDDSFVDCKEGIYLTKDLYYLQKNILPYISFDLLNELVLKKLEGDEKNL